LYVSVQTVASKTGLITKSLTPHRFKKIVKLPRKVRYAVTPTSQGGQKAFSFIKETIPFMFMREDLPSNVYPQLNNYIVVGRQGYMIEDTEDLQDGVICHCVKISGDVPKQLFDLVLKDLVNFDESMETE
jgi:hypothetical protein